MIALWALIWVSAPTAFAQPPAGADNPPSTRVTIACSAGCPAWPAHDEPVLAGGPDQLGQPHARAAKRVWRTQSWSTLSEAATVIDPANAWILSQIGPIVIGVDAPRHPRFRRPHRPAGARTTPAPE